MKNLAPELEREIISAARRCGIKRVILFGSRARGTNHPRSDIAAFTNLRGELERRINS